MGRKGIQLGKRDLAMLRFIGEQRMSWLDILHKKFYPDRELDAVKSTLRRLSGKGPKHRYVRPEPLDGKRNYFRLTGRGARMLGYPPSVARPLGRVALQRRYALQWFVEINGQGSRWTCEPEQYPELFPVHNGRTPHGNFYVEQSEANTLIGLAIEDFGSDSRRIARRATDRIERFLKQGWLCDLIAAERFVVSFLTISEGKACSLEKEFNRSVRRRLAPLLPGARDQSTAKLVTDYLVVPGLIHLTPQDTSTKGSRRHA